MKYYVVSVRADDLPQAVERLASSVALFIAVGWIPQGGVSVAIDRWDPPVFLVQAVTNSDSNAEVPQAAQSK
jgi:hypothetical protein